MTSTKKKNTTRTVPDVHFLLGPLVADTISPLNKETRTKTRLTMLERMNFEAAVSCTVTRRRGKALEVTLGKIGSVSQPGHWRSTSLFTARDAQSDSRIFQLFISVANRLYFFFSL